MKEKEYIGDHIVDYLLEEEDGKAMDPALSEWLAEDESHRMDFEQYKKVWKETQHYAAKKSFDPLAAWNTIDGINRKKRNLRKGLIGLCLIASGAAASLLLVLTLSFAGVFDKYPDTPICMAADYGNRSKVMLPDGSEIELNAGSNMTYSYNADEEIREVQFEGEGFFKVAKNKIPFVVKMADGLQVKVWGTTFNLCAYTDDETVRASLIEGCIELNRGNSTIRMNAGDMAVFDRKTKQMKRTTGLISHSYGWLDNKLYMEQMPLSEVCKYLERWYDVRITLEEGLGEQIRYDGVIQEETITDILQALSRLSKIKYEVKGKQIRITSK